jgi:hypothetical protein
MTADRKRKTTASSSGSKSAAKTARKSPAKKASAKTTAKKATAKKATKQAPAKEAPAKEAPAKEAPAKKTSASGSDQSRRRAAAPRAESKPRRSAADVAQRAAEQLVSLTGKTPEGVTGIERGDEGWRVTLEVLEVRRIPETTDVLSRYEIDTDDNGDLVGYRRAGRYTRGSAGED